MPEILHEVTPLWRSLPLERALGVPVQLKMEALQPGGSFKIRGIGRLCVNAVAQGYGSLVSSSGGNAGVATAYAGWRLGVPATVYVFAGVPEAALARMREYGAEVVHAGAGWQEAHEAASAAAAERGAYYVHPFDHPDIWAGHSTLVDEMAASGPLAETIVLAVGGGGLLAGVLDGLQRHGHTGRVVAVETHGTASLHAALAAGKLVRLERIASIAKTLGAAQVAEGAFQRAQRRGVQSVLVSDAQALAAARQFALDHRVLVEPAAGAALAAVYERLGPVAQASSVAVIVCGGAGIALRDEIFAYPPVPA